MVQLPARIYWYWCNLKQMIMLLFPVVHDSRNVIEVLILCWKKWSNYLQIFIDMYRYLWSTLYYMLSCCLNIERSVYLRPGLDFILWVECHISYASVSSAMLIDGVILQHWVLAWPAARNQGSLQGREAWRACLFDRSSSPNILAISLLRRHVDALPHGRRVHRVVHQGRVRGCQAQKDRAQVVPWCSPAWLDHGMLCDRREESFWRLPFAGTFHASIAARLSFLHLNVPSVLPSLIHWYVVAAARSQGWGCWGTGEPSRFPLPLRHRDDMRIVLRASAYLHVDQGSGCSQRPADLSNNSEDPI